MNYSRYSRTISLVQHTPMIHFQAGQAGATLRASEVKPRFDRFLYEELPRVASDLTNRYAKYLSPAYLPFVTGTENPGRSAYQMHLTGQPDKWYVPVALMTGRNRQPTLAAMNQQYPQANGRIDLLERTAYFANSDKIKDQKWQDVRVAVTYKDVKLRLTSPHAELLDLLEAALPLFLARNNFGTRNNKGFGCFLPANHAEESLRRLTPFSFSIRVDASRDDRAFHALFQQLNLLYNTLRSGINVPDRDGNTIFYFKSMLFLYFRNQDIQWDKKSIKQAYFNGQERDQLYKHSLAGNPDYPLSYQASEAKLVRDLLGLASSQTWGRDYSNATVSKSHVPTPPAEGGNGQRSIDILRAKSPLYFKPVRTADRNAFKVFLAWNPLSDLYLGEKFHIEAGSLGGLELNLPESFDLEDFLRFAFSQRLEDHVDPEFHGKEEFTLLDDLYTQIRQNL